MSLSSNSDAILPWWSGKKLDCVFILIKFLLILKQSGHSRNLEKKFKSIVAQLTLRCCDEGRDFRVLFTAIHQALSTVPSTYRHSIISLTNKWVDGLWISVAWAELLSLLFSSFWKETRSLTCTIKFQDIRTDSRAKTHPRWALRTATPKPSLTLQL